jgi:S-adenosylmethionine hydrolase
MPIITLTTDFGLRDGNVGVMKGVILALAPAARLVDLSHTIGPQDVAEAAWVLKRAVPYFPPETIHLVVVDPGVGTARRPLAARIGSQRFVGPDNGVLTRVLAQAERAGQAAAFWQLDQPGYWRAVVSTVFHGRDIFAPVAGHLAAGVPLERLGRPIADPVRLALPAPRASDQGLSGEVAHIDHFGNVATNITRADLAAAGLPADEALALRVRDAEIAGLVATFGERPAGTLVALYSSTDDLIVAEVNGHAARRLGARVGDPVEVSWT